MLFVCLLHASCRYRPPPPPPQEDVPGVPVQPITTVVAAAAADEDTKEPADTFAALEPAEQLGIVVDYLKHAHFYCFWCARQHDTLEELEEECAECSSENRE